MDISSLKEFCKQIEPITTHLRLEAQNCHKTFQGKSKNAILFEKWADTIDRVIQELSNEIEALTHKGRQGELEQYNVNLAQENLELKTQLIAAQSVIELYAWLDDTNNVINSDAKDYLIKYSNIKNE